MSKMLTWRVNIEYGPTAADCHTITVLATTSKSASKKAENWAKKQMVRSPMFSEPCLIETPADVPNIEDDYTEILEWTVEEEEAFLDILNKPKQKD